MKKLNQNNAIATTAMLTKTNIMKNRMNLFAKVVMMVVMMGMMVPVVSWGQWTLGTDNKWYIYTGSLSASDKNKYTSDISIYTPTQATCSISYNAAYSAGFTQKTTFEVYAPSSSKKWNEECSSLEWAFDGKSGNGSVTIAQGTSSLKYGWTGNTGSSKNINVSIAVPQHINVKNTTLPEIDFGEVELGQVAHYDIEFTSLFTSFLATNGFALTSSTVIGGADAFFTNSNASGKTLNGICGNNSVYAEPNNTPLSGNAGLVKGTDNKYYLRLFFKPTSSTAIYSGNFELKLGGNTVITIPVEGKGGKISPGLIWTENTDLNVGNSVVNPATVSPDNIVVTYSSSDSSKIAVNGNTLIALATTEPNKVTITATTTASGDYKSITSTKDFMVTNKQIQSITWNQKFTNLKTGGNDIQLDATATSGGSITYWVENNSTNVVTINNGYLHIVGTGDVKIYAKQAGGIIGGQEWLEVEKYKQVKVRAVGAACEECAIESNGEWSSALSNEESFTYYVKAKNGLNAPTGDILTFRCSADGSPYFKLHTYVDNVEVEEFHHTVTPYDDVRTIQLNGSNKKENILSIKFEWESTFFLGGASLSTVKISEVCLSQLSYLRQGTTTRHDFGNVQFGSSQDVYLENIAKFSALSSTIDARIVSEPGFTNASSFKIVDADGAETDETSIDVDCSDFGNLAINLKYVPQELGNLSAKLRLIGHKGTEQETIYVELHGACFSTPSLEFNNDCFTDKPVFDTNGNYYQQTLSVATNSGATPSYTLVNTPQDVAEINGNQLKIKKAGVDITVRAHVDAREYYYERNLDSTFRATTVTPTLNWKTTAMGNKTYHYGQVIDVKDLLTQDYSTNEAAKKLPYIAVSAKDAEGNDMFQSETEGNINSAKIKVIRAGQVNSLTAHTDAVSNYFTAADANKTSGCGEIDKATQEITWNDDMTGPYKVNQTPVGPLTATATSGLDVSYSEGNQGIVSIGTDKNISFAKAGYATVTASQGGNDCCWKAAASSASKSFHVDFADNFFLTCKDATVDNTSDTGFDMTDYFVPSNTSYTVSSSSTEFVVTKQNNSNYITIQFTPTSVNNGSSETQEKEATITITDNGQTYTFKVKAIAEKKDAGLTLEYIGETFAFSTITLSHSEATDAEVTLSASIGNIEDNTYKFRSTEQVTITATVPATNVFKADTKTLNFTPKAVKPRITGWSGNYGAQKVGVSCPLGQADWDVDDNVTGQPAKTEWSTGEVTITYTSSESRIAEVSGSDLVFHRAGLATITASIAEENNHNASTDNPSKSVKVDFADAGVNCGTAYAGETPAVADITDMIVSVGTISDLKTNATSTNPDFKVIVNNDRLEVRFDPSSYHEETSTARITFTDTDGQEYHLNVQGECQKHTPVIEWRSDVQTIAIAQDENDIKTEADLIDATNSQYYQPLKFKSGDVSKVKVYDENYAEAEWGIYLYPIGKGPVTIYAKAEETESHYASAEASEKQFTIIGEAKSKIAWNQNFLRIYNDQVSIPLTAEVQASSNSAPIPGATVTYHLLNVQNNVVTLNGCTLNITAGAIGTAEIYAEFAGNDDYVSCVSETLNIRVIAKPIGGMCEPIHYSDVTSGEATYYFNRSKTSAGEPYFEVEKVEYSYYVKGGNGWVAWAGTTRNIYATLGSKTDTWTGIGGSAGLFADHDGKTSSGNTTITPKNGENPNYISFTGNIGSNSGTNYGRFENIYVTPKSYFRENTAFSNPFAGSNTKVDEEIIRTFEIGKYSNLSEYTIQLWDYELNQAYSGGEFSIIDGGSSDHYPDGCNDYGDWIITVKFKPLSGKPEKVHKCKIQITYKRGTDGSNGNFNGFEIEAYASRHTQPDIIWNQDLSSLTSLSTKPTGEHWTSEEPITLTAKSGLSEADYYGTYIAVDRYEITAGTDVAEVNGDQLSIKKAGQFTIKAIHNGDDKYEPTSKERTIDIALSEPTIELSHNGTPIAENETINVTYNDPSITIDSKALYGDFEIYGYTIESGKIELSSSALDVVSIANDNQLQFLKSGDAVITATITEDDVVSSKTFTFYVHVNKAQAGLHWDDVTKYANDWIYVFETKSMTALADNNDNNGAISYDVTSGKASFSGNDITINGYGSITARAIIATTDKYLADTITNTFTPKKVTPVVSWSGSDFTTNLSNSEFTLTDEASVSETTGQPDVSNWTDGKTVVYSSTTPEVATLKQDNTFELHKVGYATIQAKVEAGDNNEASNVVERHLKVDFNPNEPIDFGEVSVYGTKTINFNLSVIKADGGGPVYGSYNTNTTDFSYGMVENGLLPLTFKPQSHDADNPIKTATITIHDGGNNQDYYLVIKGTTALAQPKLKYDDQNHNRWEFVVQLPNGTTQVVYGSNVYDVDWDGAFPNLSIANDELNRLTLSLKYNADATYVDIINNSQFKVKQANVGDDNPVNVTLVVTYPGLENKIASTSIEIPIVIKKNQYSLNWNKPDGFEIEIYQGSKTLAAPTKYITLPNQQIPIGGDSPITYAFSEDGIGTYDGSTFTITEPPYKSGTLRASIASDKYAIGTFADLQITVNKSQQYVSWSGDEIKNGFTTQKDINEGIVLLGKAKYNDIETGANITYSIVEPASTDICGIGDLVRLEVEENEGTPRKTTLYYTGNGSGTVKIKAVADETDVYKQSLEDGSPIIEFTITKEDCEVNSFAITDMHYGDKVTLEPTINKFTKGTNYEYTLPTSPEVTGTLETNSNILDVKGVGNNLTISAKKLEDCWVNESATSTASNQFNILKSEQTIDWDKKPLGTPQSDGAYLFSVFDDGTYQLATQAFDKLHRTQADTWLVLDANNKYVTANFTGNAPGGLAFTFGIIEESDVCKTDGNTIVTVDSEGKLHITGNGTGTVQIVASVDGGDYYENVAETITVVVDKALRTIAWNNKNTVSVTTASTDITLDAHSVYNSEDVSADEEGNKTYSISTGGENYVEIEEAVLKIKNGITTLPNEGVEITVNVSFANSCRYADKADSWTFTLMKENIDLQNVPTVTLSFEDLTSTTKDFDLKSVLIANYYMTTNYPDGKYSYSFESSNTDIATINAEGKVTAYEMTEDETPLQIVITATETVTGTSDSETIKVVITRGTLIFNVAAESDNKWTTSANWSRGDIVTGHTDINNNLSDLSEYNVQINGSCFIGKDEAEDADETAFLSHTINALCNDLMINQNEENAKLVIGEASTLNVAGNLNNTDASKLVLTANYWGQASVVFRNDNEHQNPKATIEMYVPEGNGSRTSPIWQYRGICVDGFAAVDGPWECMAIYQWNEADNADLDHGCWSMVTNGGDGKENIHLSPWIGYGFANICSDDDRKAENWLTYSGTLINSATHEYNLTKTSSGKDKEYANYGVNLLTNSYAAPMTIGKVDFGDNNDEAAYATVTFYNAGTHKDWEEHHTDAGAENQHGDAGQMTACPKYTSGYAQNTFTIPAGQSFFVTAKNSGNIVKFNYNDIITDLGPSRRMFLPGERESEYNVLGIRVKGKENGDRLMLLECETCTRQYDNGYDGYKMPGNEGLPQIYAYNKFGNTAVNADSTLNKQYVGFMAGSDDETYTISFETDKLFGYLSLYLTDRKLNETVDILAGETYQFKGYTVGENMRFQINGITEQEWNNENDDDDDDDDDSNVCDLRIVGNTLYVQGFTTEHYPAATIELFDMTGSSVWSTPLTSERLYDLPQLPQGIYTVRLGDCHVKYSSMK